ncbi:Uncharacterised protein [Mycobacteroides abscessus subsp. massiliense]|nr:Uncharacterised protein [Mycobacteroides abscessus subsp. massiliense]
MNRATGNGVLDGLQHDERRLRRVGVQHVHTAVGHHDAPGAVNGQSLQLFGHQIMRGCLRTPRHRDQLDTGSHPMHARGIEDVDVRGLLGQEQLTGVHRGGIQGIVVAGQQIDVHPDAAHHLQRLTDDAWGQLVGFEDISTHHHEVATLSHSNLAKGGDSLPTRG